MAVVRAIPYLQTLDVLRPHSFGEILYNPREVSQSNLSFQGLMFNIGVYMGWADLAPNGQIPYRALTAAYVGATMWTITYETVYQHQDKVDDVKIGMKSLAILCGKFTIPICSATTLGFAALMSWAGYLNGQGIAYYIAVALSAFILLKELLVTDIDSPRQCMKFFLQTPTIGNHILCGLVVDAVLQRVLAGIPL